MVVHFSTARIVAAVTLVAVLVGAAPARAGFHLMQIEQVIAGVNGDTSAQAIQLRMRSFGQPFVQFARLVAYDAAGGNPVVLINFPTQVANYSNFDRILVVSPGFGDHSTPAMVPDFVMTNPIPASYLAAGRLNFEDTGGTIYWTIAFGGGAYTGPTTGTATNDLDGQFGPAFAGPLPSSSLRALKFNGAATDLSTTNAADYSLTTGAAVFTNNNGDSFTISAPPPPCPVDEDQNGSIEPADLAIFVNIWSTSLTQGTLAGDFDNNGVVEPADIAVFVNLWFTALATGHC